MWRLSPLCTLPEHASGKSVQNGDSGRTRDPFAVEQMGEEAGAACACEYASDMWPIAVNKQSVERSS